MNRLAGATSPYLLQHADNPVHWFPWGPEALDEARRSNRPILLSIGYAACHWCHVMAHESFEDEAVAAVMNRLFVNIKVDREERPDIDQIYMAALQAIGVPGGWPLTMFLAPNGEPFWGGTYFPRRARYGQPGIVDVLEQVARVFAEDPARVASNRRALIARLGERSRDTAPLGAPLLDAAAAKLFGIMDPVEGGTRGAPKFPQTMLLELLWRHATRTGDRRGRDLALLGLERMSQGGIYDHLGGGFARYATDDRWLVPHFEKMLYDNGQLIELLCLAYAETGAPLFRSRIEATVDWLVREMRRPEGGFASSLDADSEGVEGKFYVWTEAEIRVSLPGALADLFCKAYDVRPGGNWEDASILNRSHAPRLRPDRPGEIDDHEPAQDEPPSDEHDPHLVEARALLLEARSRRVRPGLDDKVLADWNGMVVAALARAGALLDRPEWIDLATEAYRFVTESMTRGDRLGHSWRDGALVFPGMASDHAQMIRAALALATATGTPRFLDDARRWADAVLRHYWDATDGGVFMTADDAEALVVRPKPAVDEATPNANGVLAEALVRLWLLTGEDRYRDHADRLLDAFSGEIPRNVFGTASLLNALDTRLAPVAVVLVAPAGASLAPMRSVLAAATDLRIVAFVTESTDRLPRDHPARGKPALAGTPTAYVCRGTTCSLPVTEPSALRDLLAAADMPAGP